MQIDVNRTIQIWKYTPSFTTLLLLANKRNKHKTRKIFVFYSVDHINMPPYFHCTKIIWDENQEDKIFHFYSDDGNIHTIAASTLATDEDKLEFDAPIKIYEQGQGLSSEKIYAFMEKNFQDNKSKRDEN